jgi:glucose dehydrogenase (acceptor)
LRPKSRGNIRLASNDPYDKPLINPNYFSDDSDYDIKVTVESVKFSIALSKTEAFQKMGSRLYDMPYPGCEDKPLWTDEYWACWIKSSSFTLAHTVGTCRMGAATDEKAVVDPELKFIGIKNLRVADTSVMPAVPSGNSNAATVINLLVRNSNFMKLTRLVCCFIF